MWEWGCGSSWEGGTGAFPGEHQTIVLTCAENQKETQKSQAHLHCHMPAEPLHYGCWLPAGLAGLGERNALLVVVKWLALSNFVQPLSHNDLTTGEIFDFCDTEKDWVGNGKGAESHNQYFLCASGCCLHMPLDFWVLPSWLFWGIGKIVSTTLFSGRMSCA